MTPSINSAPIRWGVIGAKSIFTWAAFSHPSLRNRRVDTVGRVRRVRNATKKKSIVMMFAIRRRSRSPSRMRRRLGVAAGHGRTGAWPKRRKTWTSSTLKCGLFDISGEFPSDCAIPLSQTCRQLPSQYTVAEDTLGKCANSLLWSKLYMDRRSRRPHFPPCRHPGRPEVPGRHPPSERDRLPVQRHPRR